MGAYKQEDTLLWVKTYSNINNNIIIPKICIGIDDFIILTGGGIILFFLGIFLYYFLQIFFGNVMEYLLSFLMILYSILFYVFLKIRQRYIRKKESNILNKQIDYFLEEDFMKGRR